MKTSTVIRAIIALREAEKMLMHAAIGGPALSNECFYAWSDLRRELLTDCPEIKLDQDENKR